MAVRQLLAFFLLAVVVAGILRNPGFGLLVFTGIIYLNPASLFWGLDSYRIPLIISLVSFLSMLLNYRREHYRFEINSQHVLIVALFIVLWLSAANSFWPGRSYDTLGDWLKLFVFFFMVTIMANSQEDVEKIVKVVVLSLALLSLRGLYRYSAGWPHVTGLPHSFTEDRNDFALTLMMIVPLTVYLASRATGRVKVLYNALIGLFCVTVVLTYSRMGFVLLVLYGLLQLLQARRKFAYLVVLAGMVGIGINFVPAEYIERIQEIPRYEEDASSMGRIVAWGVGWKMMLDRPFTGVGLDCFELPGVYTQYDQEFKAHVAHNTYVQLGAEAGMVALLLFLILNAVALRQLRAVRRGSKDEQTRMLCVSIRNSLFLYFAGSVFLSVENREILYILLGVVVALRKTVTKGEDRRPPTMPRHGERWGKEREQGAPRKDYG